MMGRTHAATGVAAMVAAQPLLASHGLLAADPATQAVSVVLASGAALYPDMDHRDATVANAVPPVTRWAAMAVGAAAGGHRNGTHSFLGLAVTAAAAWAVTSHAPGWALGLWLGLTAAIGLTGLDILPKRADLVRAVLLAGCAAACAVWGGAATSWFDSRAVLWAAVVGWVAHVILGDMWTTQKVPLLWPLPTRTGVGIVTTDTWVERYVVWWLLMVAGGVVAAWRVGWLPWIVDALRQAVGA